MYKLPLNVDLDDITIYKNLSKASFSLGELKGIMNTITNPNIILNVITLAESKNSSEIENIITTYDDIFDTMIDDKLVGSAKEVVNYHSALTLGNDLIAENGFISKNDLVKIHEKLGINIPGIRTTMGTVIKNSLTGEVVHTPPQSKVEIMDYLTNLENYINNESENQALIDLAIIHYQFECIHPFYDGNGRVGRILNVLFLLLKKELDHPILYLSQYILRNKDQYYELLAKVSEDESDIILFINYILVGIDETSKQTIELVKIINDSIDAAAKHIEASTKLYSRQLIDFIYNNLSFTNEMYRDTFNVSRPTATSELRQLEDLGILAVKKVGKENKYSNLYLQKLIKEWNFN